MTTTFLIVLYVAGASAELGGVYLVIKQCRDALARWNAHAAAVERQRGASADPRWLLDPMYARYGVFPGQINQTATTVDSLVAVNTAEQIWTILLLLAGIVLGLIGNLASLFM